MPPLAARTGAAVLAALVLLLPVSAVDPEDLQKWFQADAGLSLSEADAAAKAKEEAPILTQCGVTLLALIDLKILLAGMSMGITDIRENILPLARAHVKPDSLNKLYIALSSSWSSTGGLELPQAEAQMQAMGMAESRVQVAELYGLYQTMYGFWGLGFNQTLAQQTAVQLTYAGADASDFKSIFQRTAPSGEAQALRIASASAVNADMQGLIRRYGKDGLAYYSREYQARYADQWLKAWQFAPQELHVSSDGQMYTAGQFSQHFGNGWELVWHATLEATQVRLGKDGGAHTMPEFRDLYHDDWQNVWFEAPELPCKQCKPFETAAVPPQLVV